jgi:hypothetical protein
MPIISLLTRPMQPNHKARNVNIKNILIKKEIIAKKMPRSEKALQILV